MADNIANQLGFDKNSPKRAEGALINKLDKESQNGHTCFPKNILFNDIIDELKKTKNGTIKKEILEETLKKLINFGKIKSLLFKDELGTQIEMLSRPLLYDAEQRIV